ncbi:hypothetical protein [Tepidimonas taiwanensis]|uniref:hypothetical protein n=1 Tax=Tepidimonas taiwanensis TaxID=307486 RepID=UPI0005BBF3C3|nr:hypothetical protein [Tepidimonas taiwanensis]
MPQFVDVPPLEPLLAGTLALLHWQATRDTQRPPCPFSARKLAANLRRMADHPALSEPLAIVLHRLANEWSERAARTADGWDEVGDGLARSPLH